MKPEPIEISRLFDASPARVFAAWATGERVARWFSPEGCSVPKAEIDFRPGGVFCGRHAYARRPGSSSAAAPSRR